MTSATSIVEIEPFEDVAGVDEAKQDLGETKFPGA
jgi:ATP-dependent Zn protease